MSNRTDLAIEFEEIEKRSSFKRQKIGSIEVDFIELSKNNIYKKSEGKYATLHIGKIDLLPDFCDVEKALFFCLEKLLPKERKNVLVVGLGNREITSDSVGPNTCEKILATRHIAGEFAEKIGLKNLKSISVIAPNVLGKTGIEAAEMVSAAVGKIKPDAVIVIDALCANTTENLFSVIQLCDSGISPGSGVKNARKELSFNTLGVPTVAIGVPTVVEASVIAKELTGKRPQAATELVVTPKDSDLLSHRMSEILASALNVFLQPDTDREILLSLV